MTCVNYNDSYQPNFIYSVISTSSYCSYVCSVLMSQNLHFLLMIYLLITLSYEVKLAT